MGGLCYNLLKFTVMIFNLIYMLLGLALQGTMLWLYLDESTFAPIAKDVEVYHYVIFVLIGVGIIMTIMGFLGCCGALQESQWMLAAFFSVVLVLFAGQLAVFSWLYLNRHKFEDLTEKTFKTVLQQEYGVSTVKTAAMDTMQRELQCCGGSGPSDYAKSKYNNADSKGAIEVGISQVTGAYTLPASCCHHSLSETACNAIRSVSLLGTLSSNIYSEGCAKKVMALLKEHNWVAFSVVLAILFIELVILIFSVILCCAARQIDQYKA